MSFERAQSYATPTDEIIVMIIECEEKANFMAEAGVETEQESTQANTQ